MPFVDFITTSRKQKKEGRWKSKESQIWVVLHLGSVRIWNR